MSNYQRDFIQNIKILRVENGLSQAKLAELCDVSTGTIGNIECGVSKPSFDLILDIATCFKVHPALLFASQDLLRSLSEDERHAKDTAFISKLGTLIRDYLAQTEDSVQKNT